MKRIFISAVAILLATAAVQAQTDSTKDGRHNHRMMEKGDAYKQLNLSADQQAKLKALRDDFKTQADAVKAQQLTEDERKTKMQALRQQQKTQMDAVLTTDQRAQMEKLRAEHKGRMGNGKSWNGDSTNMRRNDNREGRADLQKELNLSGEQQAKLKEIRTTFKNKAETLRNDKALTQDQKRESLRTLMQEQQEQMKTVLTKEQQEKWQSLRKEHMSRNSR